MPSLNSNQSKMKTGRISGEETTSDQLNNITATTAVLQLNTGQPLTPKHGTLEQVFPQTS